MSRRGLASQLNVAGFEVHLVEPKLGGFRAGRHGELLVYLFDGDTHDLNAFRDDLPHFPLLVVSEEVSPEAATLLFELGANGVIVEPEEDETLESAIKAVAAGLAVVPPSIAKTWAARMPARAGVELLTPDELTWLNQMADGLTIYEISLEAAYSERAMFRRIKAMYSKIGVANRTEALIWASRRGLF